jgi:nitrogen fixation NifU-like protein
MMTERVKGETLEQALSIAEVVRRMMHGEPPAVDLGDLMALEGVCRFPVRVKCALLPWMALRDALTRGMTEEERRRAAGPGGAAATNKQELR